MYGYRKLVKSPNIDALASLIRNTQRSLTEKLYMYINKSSLKYMLSTKNYVYCSWERLSRRDCIAWFSSA